MTFKVRGMLLVQTTSLHLVWLVPK